MLICFITVLLIFRVFVLFLVFLPFFLNIYFVFIYYLFFNINGNTNELNNFVVHYFVGVFNLRQHFEISYSRYANKHYITGVYITINDSYR